MTTHATIIQNGFMTHGCTREFWHAINRFANRRLSICKEPFEDLWSKLCGTNYASHFNVGPSHADQMILTKLRNSNWVIDEKQCDTF